MSQWRAVLRIARRDARRAKGRSLLVIAMIALPVLGITALAVVARTYQLSPEQKADRSIGQADVALRDTQTGAITQYDETQYDNFQPVDPDGPARETPMDLTGLVPAGSRTVLDVETGGTVSVPGKTAQVQLRSLDYADPLAEGLFKAKEGRPPKGAGEVALTTALAKRLAAGIGTRVDVEGVGTGLLVVGIVRDGSSTDDSTALLAPGVLPADDATTSTRLLVDLPSSLDASFTRAMNAQGVFVKGRGAVPGAVPTPYDSGSGRLDGQALTAISLVAGMALLEIVLLAGPAFAVGVKRQSRELALVSAVGGQRRDVARVVLGGGLVLGLAAGVVGVAGGVVLAVLGMPLVGHLDPTVPGPFELRPVEVGAIALVGVGTALLAAMLPARLAAKLDVVAALTGRRGTVRSSRRVPLLGLVATVIGALVALDGGRRRDINQVLAGSVIAELGLVALTPILVGAVGRLGRPLSVAPRLALRDAARNRSGTSPAVAAILAAVAGSVAVATVLSSIDEKDRRAYEPSLPDATAAVQFSDPQDPTVLARAREAVDSTLPVRDQTVVRTLGFDASGAGVSLSFRPAADGPCALRAEGCAGVASSTTFGGTVVGDGDVAAALSGADTPAMRRALAAGGVVVPQALVSAAGTVTIDVHRTSAERPAGSSVQAPPGPQGDAALSRAQEDDREQLTLPAAAFPADAPHQEPVLSEAAAARVGGPVSESGLLVRLTGTATQDEEDRARSALDDLGGSVGLVVERGYRSDYGAGLLALVGASALLVLGASGIATGLASADGRGDLSTLAAVGATPGLRRRLAGAQSLVTAGLGTALGVVAGMVPALGLIGALNTREGQSGSFLQSGEYPFVIPWENLAITVVVVPLIAAGAAVALTRSRLPLVRRPA